ncbi:MAG: hypothetical protein AAF918_08535 [Pseudomonadota bacterium]
MAIRVLVLLLAVLPLPAQAHFPTLQCRAQTEDGGEQLTCSAGFSDGSLTGVVELRVYSYEDELLRVIATDTEGGASFGMPEGEFYIVFDADHESPAEFDSAELE